MPSVLVEKCTEFMQKKGPLVAERPDSPDFASDWLGFLDALKSANLLKGYHQEGRSAISSLL